MMSDDEIFVCPICDGKLKRVGIWPFRKYSKRCIDEDCINYWNRPFSMSKPEEEKPEPTGVPEAPLTPPNKAEEWKKFMENRPSLQIRCGCQGVDVHIDDDGILHMKHLDRHFGSYVHFKDGGKINLTIKAIDEILPFLNKYYGRNTQEVPDWIKDK